MALLYTALLLSVGAIIVVAALVVLNGMRSRGVIAKSLDMVLFSFALPRFAPPAGGGPSDDVKLISVMEQLYASVASFRAKGWNKFLYGDPYIAVEMAVHHVGEQIHFYAAVPSKFADQFEKQVHGTFPNATTERTLDYNIFNPQGAAAGGYLTLREDPILPFQTYTDLPTDPLGPLVSAMGRVEAEGEGIALQVTVRPSARPKLRQLARDAAHHMQEGKDYRTALKLAKAKKRDEKKDKETALKEASQAPTAFEQELIKDLQAKASRPLFDCNIRLLTSAATPERADQMLEDLNNAFSQYASPELNSFKLKKLKGRALERLVYEFSFRLFNEGRSMPLSGEEVASVYHFPVSSAILPKVKFAAFKTVEPPANIPAQGLAFGVNTFHGQETVLRLQAEERLRHLYIIGQTGTGKSVTLKSMMVQDMENGQGMTVIDPHGEFAEWSLERVPKNRLDDVIYFNPADVEYPMALNMLEYDPTSPQEKTLIIDELFEIMDKLYNMKEFGGPQFEQFFKNATFLLLDNYERVHPTLADLSRVFIDEAFRRDLLVHETNPIVKQFWEQDVVKRTGEQSLSNWTGYVTSKVDAFTSNDFLRPIINQPASAINFKDIIENRKILIVNLSKGRIGDMNADLLGMVIIGKLRRAAMARDTTRTDLPDHFVYMDEFQNITTQSISYILSEARKYHLGLVMAHQFIAQLDESIRDAVFGNVGNMLVFRVSAEDAENPKVKVRFEPRITPADISNVANNNAYVTMLLPGGQVAPPTSMRTLLSEFVIGRPSNPAMRDAIIEISRLRYARSRAEVDAEINERFARMAALRA